MSTNRGAAAGLSTILELRNLVYAYPGGHVALDRVDLTIQAGESVAILGANGSGKSTLMRILSALDFAASGEFRAFGSPVDDAAMENFRFATSFRRRIGFVFQNSDAQLFSSTVKDEIAFGPLQMGLTEAETISRIQDVAAMLEIGHLLERPPFRLSGGEKKRAALASILVMNPEVILLDEPTNGLDPRSRAWLTDILRGLHSIGKTVVTSTHDLEFARSIADRAIVLGENHKIAADGPTAEVLMNTELLLRVNLIHDHFHYHGAFGHAHSHSHPHAHEGMDGHTHDHE